MFAKDIENLKKKLKYVFLKKQVFLFFTVSEIMNM